LQTVCIFELRMAKQQKKQVKPNVVVVPDPLPALTPLSTAEKILQFLSETRIQIGLIVALTALFYANSIPNDYALDDIMFVTHNKFVQEGTDGISDLFTKESMYGFIGNASPISGGRWRPLSLITFAIEKEYFGTAPHTSHVINLLLLALTGIIMLLFLRQYVFTSSPILAFITVVLFIVHPVHVEAVTNIKSRDELLSWLFLILTMYSSLNFFAKRNYLQLLLAVVFYFLGLLSKENGITFLAILPLTFYVFTKEKISSIILTTIPFAVVCGIYIILRITYVPFVANNHATEIMNAPYLYATTIQRLATVMMMLGKYILLLFWPNPLSADYSYNQVPYVTFSDWRVLLSVFVQAFLAIYAIIKIKDRDFIAYGILFYFCSIFIYSNLFIDIGTFIGERFLFQPSFGFILAIVVLGDKAFKKIKFSSLGAKISSVSILMLAVIILSGFQTIKRNTEWKNDMTLWPADVNKVPNSARAQNGCGMSQILLTNKEKDSVKKVTLLNEAIAHLRRAHQIQPTYIDPWLNMGVAYSRLNDFDSAEMCWDRARKLDSTHPMLVVQYDPDMCIDFMNAGLKAGAAKDYQASIKYFYRALRHNKKNADVWYNLGGVYFTIARYDSAGIAWQQCLKLKPNYDKAKQGMQALTAMENRGARATR